MARQNVLQSTERSSLIFAFNFCVGVMILLMGGCATVQTPVHPSHSITVYLTQQVIHSSLVLPMADGRYVEYAPGDWTYVAVNKRDIFHAMGALFCSQQAALGRRYLSINPKQFRIPPELKGYSLTPIVVDQTKETALLASMAQRYAAGRTPTFNKDDRFTWVAVDQHYSILNNCNTLAQEELLSLGCKVNPRSIFAGYNVEEENTNCKMQIAK